MGMGSVNIKPTQKDAKWSEKSSSTIDYKSFNSANKSNSGALAGGSQFGARPLES